VTVPGRQGEIEPSLLTAEKMLAWRRSRGEGLARRAPQRLLVTHQSSLLGDLAPRLRSRRAAATGAEVRLPFRDRVGFGVAHLRAAGAPAMAMLVEELAALGTRAFVSVDLAAALEPSLASGDVLIAASALPGDGTSPHYLGGSGRADAAPALLERAGVALRDAGVESATGVVWSTDAPYRETAALVARARSQGARALDMETAALYAAGAALGVSCLAVLVIADSLADEWRPPEDLAAVEQRLRRVAVAVRGLLAS
jgi:purine-nucleoside phosphorylase